MTDLNSRFQFDALVRQIDDPDNESVIIITVGACTARRRLHRAPIGRLKSDKSSARPLIYSCWS